ncbi:MAG TPA: glycosyl hydrolase family 28 protein, partial [bacterium]|nr:glycosyl hydrolase family 28 protein [bacterium]
MIRIIECTNVTVRDVTIRNSPMWVQHYLACDNVNIDGITVHSRRLHVNNDGLDIDCCHKVRIANCEINSGDDAIVLKATSDRKCRDVTVTNCVLSSATNAFKLGTESNGGFENIVFSNSTIYDSDHGLALEEVDGAVFDRVSISNIIMNRVSVSIFIRLGNRARPYQSVGTSHDYTIPESARRPGIGSLRNVYISNIQARDVSETGCSITGLPDHPVENITLENIRILFEGGGTTEDAERTVPELPEHYPSAGMFGTLPAYGFYCRHARNLNFHHVEIGYVNEDKRPALICEDVEGLRVDGFDAEINREAQAVVWLRQVREAFITGNRPARSETTFLRLDGERTRQISIQGNDFSQIETVTEHGQDVPGEAVYMGTNR